MIKSVYKKLIRRTSLYSPRFDLGIRTREVWVERQIQEVGSESGAVERRWNR